MQIPGLDRATRGSRRATIRALIPTGLDGRLSRRTFLSALGAAGVVAVEAACAPTTASAGTTTKPDGKLESKLAIYTWGEYDDPKVLKSFTSEVGPQIVLGSYTSNEEMIAKLIANKGQSGYDIVVPSSYVVPQMIKKGLLAELDHALLPNMKNVSSTFLNQAFDPGNRYSVVKDVGVSGYVYDTTKITRELTTWADFWDAAQHEASGDFSLLDSSGEWFAAYCNANMISETTTDAGHLAAYERFMTEKIAPKIQTFDDAPGGTAIPRSSRALIQTWNGDARFGILANKDPDRYRWVFPGPITNRWQDTWAIADGARDVDAAHSFLNYILSSEAALREVQYIGYDTTTKGLQDAAKRAGMERSDMVFFTDDQLAQTQLYAQTSAAQRLSDIESRIRAAAG